MGQRWDSEQIDDVRRAVADISAAAAAACAARRSATSVALLAGDRAGRRSGARDATWPSWSTVHAVDGALRRGVRARLRDHRELRSALHRSVSRVGEAGAQGA